LIYHIDRFKLWSSFRVNEKFQNLVKINCSTWNKAKEERNMKNSNIADKVPRGTFEKNKNG
jgi:hypothetical protein